MNQDRSPGAPGHGSAAQPAYAGGSERQAPVGAPIEQPRQPGDPTSVGPFELLGRLGAGGMGVVFLGRDSSGRLAAVKVIRPEVAHRDDFRRRFAREVEAIECVSAAFTAPVLASDVTAPRQWVATEYVPGPTLADHIDATGPMSTEQVRLLGLGLARALSDIHAAGLVHRDLKPSNVVLAATGPRIIDFGIAQANDLTQLTEAGMYLGSLAWMAPEQVQGSAVTSSTDIFALGLLLGYAATGRHPYGEGRPEALAYRITSDVPRLEGMSSSLAKPVGACLHRDSGRRPSAEQLMGALSDPGTTAIDVVTTMNSRWGATFVDDAVPDGRTVHHSRPSDAGPRRAWRRVLGGSIAGIVAAAGLLGASAVSDSETRSQATAEDPEAEPQAVDTRATALAPDDGEEVEDRSSDAAAAFSSLRASEPAHVFSDVVPDDRAPWTISAADGGITLWKWFGDWRVFQRLLEIEGMNFTNIERVDVDGDGRLDFLVSGTDSTGAPFGTVIVNDEGRFGQRVDLVGIDGLPYGTAFALAWDGRQLISDYASHGAVSVPGGHERTEWVYTGRDELSTPQFVERPS